MDYLNLQKLRYGGCPDPSCACVLPVVAQVAGQHDLAGVTPERSSEPKKTDYNHLSIADAAFLGSFRHNDPWHRSDRLAETHNRGAQLFEFAKTHGTDKFINQYQPQK